MRQIAIVRLVSLIIIGLGLFLSINSAVKHIEKRHLRIRKRRKLSYGSWNRAIIMFFYILILGIGLSVLFVVLYIIIRGSVNC